jgi:hypothetical protein
MGSFQANSTADAPKDVQLGPWYQKQTQFLQVNTGAYTTNFVQEACVALPGDYVVDSKLKAVRAFSIMAPLIGGLLAIPLCFAPFSYFVGASTWKSIAMLFIVILTLFQALTFLVLTSSACSENPILSAAPTSTNSQNAGGTIANSAYKSTCTWGAGSNANVVAVVLWFLTGVAMLVVGVPVRPPPEPVETQEVTYEKTTNPEDGTVFVTKTGIVKGTAVPFNQEPEAAEKS